MPLLVWWANLSIFRPRESKVYFHTVGPQHEAMQMDGVFG